MVQQGFSHTVMADIAGNNKQQYTASDSTPDPHDIGTWNMYSIICD